MSRKKMLIIIIAALILVVLVFYLRSQLIAFERDFNNFYFGK